MAKFFGKVGFATTVKTKPGVMTETIVERSYYGDVMQNSRQLVDDGDVISDISVQNTIEILADAYADENFFAIRYIEWSGVLWIVQNVQVKRPRLILRLGGVYNGPRAT